MCKKPAGFLKLRLRADTPFRRWESPRTPLGASGEPRGEAQGRRAGYCRSGRGVIAAGRPQGGRGRLATLRGRRTGRPRRRSRMPAVARPLTGYAYRCLPLDPAIGTRQRHWRFPDCRNPSSTVDNSALHCGHFALRRRHGVPSGFGRP